MTIITYLLQTHETFGGVKMVKWDTPKEWPKRTNAIKDNLKNETEIHLILLECTLVPINILHKNKF